MIVKAEIDRLQASAIERRQDAAQTPDTKPSKVSKLKPRDPLDSFRWGVYSGFRRLADNTLGD